MKTIKRSLGLLLVAMFILTVMPSTGYAWDFDSIIVQQEIKGVPFGEFRYSELGVTKEQSKSRSTIEFTPVDGATYTATSSDSNILKVSIGDSFPEGFNSKGEWNKSTGYINMNGLKEGQVTVTLKQTLNGKNKIVGTSKITVKAPELTAIGNYKHNYPLGSNFNTTDLRIRNRNLNAKYTFESDKEGLVVSDVLDEKTGRIDIKFNATKSGTYKVIAKETVNGVTKIMKTVTVNIHEMTQKKEITIDTGHIGKGVLDIVEYWNSDYNVYYEVDGIDTVYEPLSNWDYINYKKWDKSPLVIVRNLLSPVKTGSMKLKLYRISSDIDYEDYYNGTEFEKEYIGTTTITIVPAK